MRYYDIQITSPEGQPIKAWTTFFDGTQIQNPNAQDVEFDLMSYDFANPMGDSSLTVWGVSLQDIGENFRFGPTAAGEFGIGSQATNGFNIVIKGGMGGGLPLENPAQAGPIFAGNIWQAWGNWVGTDMNIGFICKGAPFTLIQPGNFSFYLPTGGSLASAIQTTLQTATASMQPQPQIVISINDTAYNFPDAEVGVFSTMQGFAQRIQRITSPLNPPGVSIVASGGRILVSDGSYQPKRVQINFTDLVGQPTWTGQYQVQIVVVMRGDISVNDQVVMPSGYMAAPGLNVSLPTSYASYRNSPQFNGPYWVKAVRHVGRFRDPDGTAWITILQCVPVNVNVPT